MSLYVNSLSGAMFVLIIPWTAVGRRGACECTALPDSISFWGDNYFGEYSMNNIDFTHFWSHALQHNTHTHKQASLGNISWPQLVGEKGPWISLLEWLATLSCLVARTDWDQDATSKAWGRWLTNVGRFCAEDLGGNGRPMMSSQLYLQRQQ